VNAGEPVFATGDRQVETKTAAAARAALAVQGTDEKGVANGYASLGADGKVPDEQLPDDIGGDPASSIHAASEKTPPANDDEFTFVDSAASWVLRKIKWSSLVSTFGGLFSSIGHTHSGVYEPADADIQAHVTGTGSPHTPAGIGAEVAGAAVAAVGSHESSYNHALLHSPVTVGAGLSLFGQHVVNTDLGSVAVTGHEEDYDHTRLHDQNTDTGTTNADFTVDSDSATGKLKLSATAGAANKTLTLTNAALNDDRTITLPDASGTVAMDGDVQPAVLYGLIDDIPPAISTPLGTIYHATDTGAVWYVADTGGGPAWLGLCENFSAVFDHETAHDHSKLHDPVTVAGNGLTLFGQQVTLNVGAEIDHVASGLHDHSATAIDFAASSRILGRSASGAGKGEELTLSQLLDMVGSAAEGDILYRGASAWSRLAKGAALQVLRQNSGLTAPEWAAPFDCLSVLAAAEITIDSAATATIGRMHLITDSSSPADYSVALPAVSGNAGKFVGFRVSNAATKTFTIDPDGTEKIWCQRGEVTTRKYVATETVVLQCDGTRWHVLYETLRSYSVQARQSTKQSINTTTITVIQYQTEDWDFQGCWDNATNYRFTPTAPGLYLVTASMGLDSLGADKSTWIAVRKNGATSPDWGAQQIIAASGWPIVSQAHVVSLNGSTDYVDVVGFHTHGSARDTYVGASNNYNVISIQRLCREES